MKTGATVAAVALAFTLSAAASAHEVGLSRGSYHAEGDALIAELAFARREIVKTLPATDANGDGDLDAREIAAAKDALKSAVVDRLVVTSDGAACPGEMVRAEPSDSDGLLIDARYRCAAGSGAITVDHLFLEDLAFGHRHIARLPAGESPVLSRSARAIAIARGTKDVAPPLPASSSLLTMVRTGIEHILTGYDHLLFLLGLVLVGGRWKSIALAITAFTVGHSITLALAALDIWAPSPRIVEPAIALSIAYVGIENYFVKDADKRWRITAPFGLIHGFGFAGALREIALAKNEVPRALFGFNLGVELGQLAVMALALPLIFYARRKEWFRDRGVQGLSGAIALAGVALFILRLT